MVFKITAKAPPQGGSIKRPSTEFPERVVDFLRKSEGKRIAVLFKPGKRGRMRKVTVNFEEDTEHFVCCGVAGRGTFEFTR